jgi:hypothetical protein
MASRKPTRKGAYYLEWREGVKRVRLSVGKDPADATALSKSISIASPEKKTGVHATTSLRLSLFQ